MLATLHALLTLPALFLSVANTLGQAPIISREPNDLTVIEGCPATFSVEAEGAEPLTFQWFMEGELIPDANEPTLIIPHVTLADTGSRFYCVVNNAFGSIQSRSAYLNVSLDSSPPHVAAVRTGNNLQQVTVIFSGGGCGGTPMNAAAASDQYNYSFAGELEIFDAQFLPPNIVVLATASQTQGKVYTLHVSGVMDETGNMISPTSASFRAMASVSKAPAFRWAHNVPGGDDDGGYGVASDRAGNFYVTMYLWTNATLGGVELQGAGVFVAKYDENGNLLRAFKASSGGGFSQGLAVDKDGNIFVAGAFYGTTFFGSVQLFNNDRYRSAGFLAKYSPVGVVLWARAVPEGTFGTSTAVAVDAEGNSYVSGAINPPEPSAFVAKYDPGGNEVWTRYGAGTNRAFAVAVDEDKNCIVGGLFTSGARFGNITLTSRGGASAFLAKYDMNGTVLWARSEGGDYIWNTIYALSVDPSGNIYASGNYSGPGAFGTWPPPPGANAFVAKYAPTGRRSWVRSWGGSLNDIGFAIATDAAGSCYAAGVLQGSAAFGSFLLVDPGIEDLEEAFVLKLDTNGELLWAKQAGGARDDYGYGIALNRNGNCFISGFYTGPASFDAQTLMSDSERGQSFVAMIAPEQPMISIRRSADFVELAWPLWASHFGLEAATALGMWAPLAVETEIVDRRVRARLNATGPQQFFRLRHAD